MNFLKFLKTTEKNTFQNEKNDLIEQMAQNMSVSTYLEKYIEDTNFEPYQYNFFVKLINQHLYFEDKSNELNIFKEKISEKQKTLLFDNILSNNFSNLLKKFILSTKKEVAKVYNSYFYQEVYSVNYEKINDILKYLQDLSNENTKDKFFSFLKTFQENINYTFLTQYNTENKEQFQERYLLQKQQLKFNFDTLIFNLLENKYEKKFIDENLSIKLIKTDNDNIIQIYQNIIQLSMLIDNTNKNFKYYIKQTNDYIENFNLINKTLLGTEEAEIIIKDTIKFLNKIENNLKNIIIEVEEKNIASLTIKSKI